MIFFFSVVAPYHLHVLLCFDQFLHPSHFVPVVYPLVKFHGVVLFLITCKAKLLNADWLILGAFFLKNKGTFNLVMFILTFGAAFRKGFITRHRVQMQFPQKFCPLFDKQVIASAFGKLEINFTHSFKVFFSQNCPSCKGKLHDLVVWSSG